MLNVGQAARAVSGEGSARSRAYARLLDARSDLLTLTDALSLSDDQNPDDADDNASVALGALLRDHDPLAIRLAAALLPFGRDVTAVVRDASGGDDDRATFGTVSSALATAADEVLADLRRERVPLPEAFVNLVWMVQRKPDAGVDIRLTAVTTDRRTQEYVDGMRDNHPGAEVISERILLDHLYGLRDTIQAMVVGAMMAARGLRRPPRSMRRPS
jgi:hypothetical protein